MTLFKELTQALRLQELPVKRPQAKVQMDQQGEVVARLAVKIRIVIRLELTQPTRVLHQPILLETQQMERRVIQLVPSSDESYKL